MNGLLKRKMSLMKDDSTPSLKERSIEDILRNIKLYAPRLECPVLGSVLLYWYARTVLVLLYMPAQESVSG